jgi:hypothetical protein
MADDDSVFVRIRAVAGAEVPAKGHFLPLLSRANGRSHGRQPFFPKRFTNLFKINVEEVSRFIYTPIVLINRY